ncbi:MULTISPECIES: phosphohydrolase [unclassified Novosphingobium]|uniref:phosphohydrolase n=1 Tax=unclassified Novosphingobium TaxID=2644732 RepID=UPI001F334ED7|nr:MULTISPECIES: phosphohydrolase [unclassified Novosphingobium]
MSADIIDTIFCIFNDMGHVHYGEDITQMQHVLQCGQLAQMDGASASLVAAALMHDIGQFLDGAGDAAEQQGIDARHEVSGAAFLAPHFPPAVTRPILLHVAAKRYLCAVEPGYTEALSRASILSLGMQGGPMNAAQQAEFLRDPHFTDAIALRRYDDHGKRPQWDVPDLESYRPLLESVRL